jgi:glycosyltransferase involved in cell wall biosynthesis
MMEHVAWQQIVGAHTVDWNVFNSEYCQWMFEDMASEYSNPEILKNILAKSSMIPMGTLDINSLRYRENDNEKPIIIYNHRLQQYKGYQKTMEIFQKLWDEGLRFEVVVTSSTAENTKRVLKLPFVRLELCATRADYLNVLKTGDLNVTNSSHETFCISAVESMAFGQPLIGPNGITFPQITGAKELGYPYLFDTEDQQVDMVRKMLTDVSERRKWGQRLSKYVRSRFNHIVWASQYADLIDELISNKRFTPSTPDDVLSFIRKKLDLNDGASVRDFWNAIGQVPVNGRRPFGSQSLPYVKLVRLVRHVGGSVRIDDGVQRVYANR